MYCQKIIISTILLVSSSLVTANEQSINELQELLIPIVTLKAQFQQTVVNDREKVLQQSSGNLEFKRPNLFRWQVESPESNLVVTDGKKLWNYDADLEQVTVQDYKNNNEVSPISFLFDDIEKLRADFEIVKIGDAKSFRLTPKRENASFVSVDIYFANTGIKELRLLDHLGQISVFKFKNVKNNEKINNTHFTFIPPAGVDVIGGL